MRKIKWLFSLLSLLITFNVAAQTKSLHQLQQEFVDLRLGLFVHFVQVHDQAIGLDVTRSFQSGQTGLQPMGRCR